MFGQAWEISYLLETESAEENQSAKLIPLGTAIQKMQEGLLMDDCTLAGEELHQAKEAQSGSESSRNSQ
jgi:hypothetical protein